MEQSINHGGGVLRVACVYVCHDEVATRGGGSNPVPVICPLHLMRWMEEVCKSLCCIASTQRIREREGRVLNLFLSPLSPTGKRVSTSDNILIVCVYPVHTLSLIRGVDWHMVCRGID